MKSRSCSCHSHNGFLLSPEGLAQRELVFSDDLKVLLTDEAEAVRLDKSGSVSGSILPLSHWDDDVIEEQYRRFHNGS